eukprot:scaffold35472_cov31-Tisochrysis_lutea.AAC.3
MEKRPARDLRQLGDALCRTHKHECARHWQRVKCAKEKHAGYGVRVHAHSLGARGVAQPPSCLCRHLNGYLWGKQEQALHTLHAGCRRHERPTLPHSWPFERAPRARH